MLPDPAKTQIVTHWGIYEAFRRDGKLQGLLPIAEDPDPSPIANGMVDALTNTSRILRPAVRKSYLERGASVGGEGRGAEAFVEVSWDTALDLAAAELNRVRTSYGNRAIYGGSYGWGSAGRFHHAQSQIHRFLNTIGGYARSVQNYSFAAGEVILPHVIGDNSGVASGHTLWREVVAHTKLLVMFGGLPRKNSAVNSGGIFRHTLRESLTAAKANGAALVSISPIRNDVDPEHEPEWISVRPNADVALMLGLAHTLVEERLHDTAFLATYTVGYSKFEDYLLGTADGIPKSADWAAAIADVPADQIRSLARRMAKNRTMIMVAWALQRAEHGEQPYWMGVTLAAMLGQIGLPGGGFGFGYGSVNSTGNPTAGFQWPSLPQGLNKVTDFIPVARIADMLLNPGSPYEYNGQRRIYPDIKLVYWAGGNPFHHHQDLNRLRRAWRKPETVIVHDSWWNGLARHADIVFPVTTALERNDIGASGRDLFIAASHCVSDPAGEARNDYDIFGDLARRMDREDAFTEGRNEEAWLRHLYSLARQRASAEGGDLPDFESFWSGGIHFVPEAESQPQLLEAFRRDPVGNRLATPSGLIEIFSQKIASFEYRDCPGHPTWLAPSEWLGSEKAKSYPLHLMSNQPATRLHSQYDCGIHSSAAKIHGREVMRMNPKDAEERAIREHDVVRVFNDRGACLATVVLSDHLRESVVQLPTGAWYDPSDPAAENSLEKHGNPNVLTRDVGTSQLAQGTSAHTCLVEVERFCEELPPVTAFVPPIASPSRRRGAGSQP